MSDAYLKGVQPLEVTDWWPFLLPFINSALARGNGEMLAHDIHDACIDGDMQMFGIFVRDRLVGALTTEIVKHRRKSYGFVRHLAGDGCDDWLHLTECLEGWFKAIGVDALLIQGREGWKRKLAKHGYELDSIVMRKEL